MNSNEVPNEAPTDFHPRRRWFHFVFFGPMILVFMAVKAALVMLLWNYLIPDLFSGPVLEFGHAFGLLVLAKLFVGFGPRGYGHGPWGRHRRHRHWKNMSPEQREKMREALRDRCGRWK